ncbi:unnamed protein product [Prorocentrum cordatum]|uniref:Pentatricopeptide repeat-containing protein n=1 Tax=Prorocentrum cordatum TaxID=2364126 RepID=A0ABN9XYZ6_9DINO|nr:unnamed protein product [Polarella glacialis]
MRGATVDPDIITYNAGITACYRGEQWQHALSLLSEMRDKILKPTAISYNIGVSACEKGTQWQRALSLLNGVSEATWRRWSPPSPATAMGPAHGRTAGGDSG